MAQQGAFPLRSAWLRREQPRKHVYYSDSDQAIATILGSWLFASGASSIIGSGASVFSVSSIGTGTELIGAASSALTVVLASGTGSESIGATAAGTNAVTSLGAGSESISATAIGSTAVTSLGAGSESISATAIGSTAVTSLGAGSESISSAASSSVFVSSTGTGLESITGSSTTPFVPLSAVGSGSELIAGSASMGVSSPSAAGASVQVVIGTGMAAPAVTAQGHVQVGGITPEEGRLHAVVAADLGTVHSVLPIAASTMGLGLVRLNIAGATKLDCAAWPPQCVSLGPRSPSDNDQLSLRHTICEARSHAIANGALDPNLVALVNSIVTFIPD